MNKNSDFLLIIGTMPEMAPYVSSYTDILDDNGKRYDIVCWNRFSDELNNLPGNYHIYERHADIKLPYWRKIIELYGFFCFVKSKIKKGNYKYIIVFTITESIFLQKYLEKRFKHRYIYDIRDFSPIMKFSYFKNKNEKMIANSLYTVISSPGFLKWLPVPKPYNIIIGHNTTSKQLSSRPVQNNFRYKTYKTEKIQILTIGSLRDYEANAFLIAQFKNRDIFNIVFAGTGIAENDLKEYAHSINANNVFFEGRYQKKDEQNIVSKCQMINIYLNHDINSDTLLSNRFYLALLFKKPMIVRKDTYQAQLVERYDLGAVVDEKDEISEKVIKFWHDFDETKFNKGCENLLKTIEHDMNVFKDKLLDL